jgi:predicted nucleic acid-binding protein
VKVFFDTSVLVAAMVEELPNHETAMEAFLRWTQAPHNGCCTNHALAECYATLTALPLARRIQPLEARLMIEENLAKRLEILEIGRETTLESIRRTSESGFSSGVVYDALHLISAEQAGCDKLLTYNLRDFRRLDPRSIIVTSP